MNPALPVHLAEQATNLRRRERNLVILAVLFVLVNALAYSVVASDRLSLSHLWAPVVWALAVLGVRRALNQVAPLRDPVLLPVVAFLTGWGIILADRLAANFMPRQTLWVIIGLGSMVAVAGWPRARPGDPSGLRWLRRYRYTWLIAGFVLLGLTLLFGVNPSGRGLRFWLGGQIPLVGALYFQPSELLKLLAVAFLASYMAERADLIQIRTSAIRFGKRIVLRVARPPLAYLGPLLVMWGVSLALLALQRDLGAAIIFLLLFLIMVYLASGRWESVASGLVLLAGTVLAAYWLPLDELEVVRLRLDSWINPWPEAQGRAFQIVQSLMALASGGVLGQGIGQGYPTFIPVVHSDFVFAAVGEEWGLLGTLTVVALVATLVSRGIRLALLSRRPFEAYLAAGIASIMGIQSVVIMTGVTRLLPLTGITLPFMSYGGSSMLISCLMVGLLLKLSGEALAA